MTTRNRATFEYVSGRKYDGLMGRCYRESDKSFPNYGGSGIRVCGEWARDIQAFRLWLLSDLARIGVSVLEFIEAPAKYQIDRKDPAGHYTPNNCRIASPQANNRNRSSVKNKKIITAEGEEICFGA